MKKLIFILKMIRSLCKFFVAEIKRGTLSKNVPGVFKLDIKKEMSWGELIEEKAKKYKDKPFLMFEDKTFTYKEMNANSNRIANFFKKINGGKGKGVAILMDNSPRFLDIFFGVQKIGMYSVPVNCSLRGDSLLYILNHCDAEYLVMDENYAEPFNKIADKIENIKTIIVNNATPENTKIKFSNILAMDDAYKESDETVSDGYNEGDLCIIMYTSGTTGLPKGVVYRYGNAPVKLLSLVANVLYTPRDVTYTCMPLFHGNALFVTTTNTMHAGAKMVLGKKFSASRHFEDIRKYGVTTFNTIGAMISILMKQPEKDTDIDNNVRFIISAACPPDLWEPFETRFGIKIYETYGAVDGGGKTILNLDTAPRGSIGKPPMNLRFRLMDDKGNEVPKGTPGEMAFAASEKGSSVEYYKNPEASNKKASGGWIYTGDLMRQDKKGNLYFVGRNTESMRIKGENVSAYEVEQTIMKHPQIMEAAVYAVPSELGEDDIMASITIMDKEGFQLDNLFEYLADHLAKFAIPRYVKVIDEFEKTETQRIIKKPLEKLGVVSGTYDRQKKEFVSK